MFLNKNSLTVQVKNFIAYRPKTITIDDDDKENLFLFVEMCGKYDISEVTGEDVEMFENHLRSVYTQYQTWKLMSKVKHLLRYYHFHNMAKKYSHKGRPPKLLQILKAKKLISEGNSFREAAEKMNKNPSQIHRWFHYEYKPSEKEPS